jgi:hypothetical protein
MPGLFARDPVTLEEVMHRADPDRCAALDQPCLDLGQGHVTLLGNQLPDKVAVRFDLARMPVTAARFGNCLIMLKSKLPPADRARGADPQVRRSRAATHAAVNRRNNPAPKIL